MWNRVSCEDEPQSGFVPSERVRAQKTFLFSYALLLTGFALVYRVFLPLLVLERPSPR